MVKESKFDKKYPFTCVFKESKQDFYFLRNQPINVKSMNPELVKAYQTTNYFIEGMPKPIRVGEEFDFNLAQKKFGKADKLNTLAFISAYNPFSKPLSQEENLERAKELIRLVEEMGLSYTYGYGEDPSGQWPREYSLAIWNASQVRASKIARHFEQNAYVWAMRDKQAEIVLL
jgi:hypothetical protein